ncbi:chitobiase/beta-hexosaminidase C-terminal domain protein [Leptospira wolbachii serovar Codice str. CDC]|uniref:Chitobiase/beta-hexosaminidase C-terminal domain protein n=1 Tax=Leptospira wolbachii serovar Codice str. CDC TaxID=1218599 RepID=R9A9U1_9LEPT|nr:chitobiase/beta-hexosaminidase C-terminal domain-containing protein [Leptospira wolbachii]EOQ96990.1 chitobiase/beta-hexosaminidase C-terminal domain protein [Leptospira wolbachii serovar Codice str. CDC]
MNRKLLFVLLLGIFSFNCIGFLLPNKEQKNPSMFQSLLGFFWGNPNNVRTVSGEVGPAGGSLKASDGSFSFEIPPGALAETKVITISRDASSNGSIPAEYGSATPIFKFEPEGLKFSKPATLTVTYNQGNFVEAGIEERSLGMYYIKDDSTLEKMKKVAVDYSNNTIKVEVIHFSFGVGLNIQIWLVSSGIITNPTVVTNIANNIIDELSNYADYGYASVSEYYQANAGVLGPLLNQLVAVLGTDPITAAFPTADFDGDGAPNFEDPMVPSLGPVITVSSISSAYISATNGSINSTDFTWRSSKTGTYSIRKNAADCNTGTIIYSGNVTANVNNNSGSILASSLNLGTNAIRVCVISAGVTGFGVASVTRDDAAPGVTVLPSGGSFGTIQSVVANCSDTGGAGCSKIVYTSNGTSPAFNANCSISNGTQYTGSLTTPNQTTTTYKFKSCDNAGNQSIVYSESYTVDTIIPTITINSVLPSTYLMSGQTATISWKSDKEGGYEVKLGTSCATGTTLTGTNVTGNVSANVSTTSEIPVSSLGAEGSKSIFVCVSNLVGTKGGTSVDIIVDFTIPTIAASVNTGTYTTPQTLTISCTDIHSGCHEIIYTNNGTTPAFDASGTIVNGQLYTGSIITPNNAVLEYRFLARDHAGNVSGELVRNYTIGELIPKFTSFDAPEYGMKGVIDETEKSITLHINNPMHPFILPTYTTENTTSIVYTHALPQLIEFQPDDESVHLTYMEGRQLSAELTLISPTGTTVNYKIYTMMLNASVDPSIMGLSAQYKLFLIGWFSEQAQFHFETPNGNIPISCAKVYNWNEFNRSYLCNFTPINNANGYLMDLVVTETPPFHTFRYPKKFKMAAVKNGAGEANGEIPYCYIKYPTSITQPVPGDSEMIYARVYYPGLTNYLVENAAVTGHIGIGTYGTDPRTSSSWRFVPAKFNPTDFIDHINNAEYAAKVSVYPGITKFSYVARFSIDGGLNYTYCDTDGSGSNVNFGGTYYPELEFTLDKLGLINVTNPNP